MNDREMLRQVAKALEDLSFECFGGIGTTAPSVNTYNRTFGALESVRDYLAVTEPGSPDQPRKLWLWKNFVDGKPEYWAFSNPFPHNLNDGDPQTLGEPCGYAIFKPSRDGSDGRTEEEVLRAIARAAGVKGPDHA